MNPSNFNLPSQQAKKKRHRLSVAMIGLSLILFLTLVGIFGWNAFNSPELGEDLCIQGEAPAETWSILIDVSDVYNRIQVESIRNQIREIRDAMPKHALVALFSVRPSAEELLTPLVAMCNPGDGSDLSALTANPEMARRQWKEQFEQPLERVLSDLVTSDEQLPRSPIMEGIQAQKVALEKYGDSASQHLVVISDMMQHSDVWSQYGASGFDFDRFVGGRAFDRVRTDLSGWAVTLFYVRRAELSQQGRGHIDFWDDIFSSKALA